MTVDITPEAVERLIRRHSNMLHPCTATTLRALSESLTASQAETAAAYEVAALTCMDAYPEDGTYEPKDFNIRDAERATVECCKSSIRALTPADSKAALDRMIAEARAETPAAWQPFETAPYDTHILVWYVNRIISCIVPKASQRAYVWVEIMDGFKDGFQLGVKPSHWMPCPPKPDAETLAPFMKGGE
jgi:hypothetical protein